MFDVFCLPIQFPFTLASLSHGLPRLPGRWTSTDHFHGFSCPWLPVGFSQWEALAAGDGNIGEEFMAFISTGNLPNSCQTSFSIELYALGFSNCSILRFFFRPWSDNSSPGERHCLLQCLFHKPKPYLT